MVKKSKMQNSNVGLGIDEGDLTCIFMIYLACF